MIYQLPELLTYPQITHGFSTRPYGNMSFKWGETEDVVGNRKKFLQALKLNPSNGVSAELMHQNSVRRVGNQEANTGILQAPSLQVDGLITNEPGIFLMSVVADCLTISFYDTINQAIGLAHAGRRKPNQDIVQMVVKKMSQEFNTDPANLIVGLGPSIHSCCYGFSQLPEGLNDWAPFIKQRGDGLYYINLVGWYIYQLSQSGVVLENIYLSEHCTAHSGKFFSHYKDQKNKQPEARFAALIGLKK